MLVCQCHNWEPLFHFEFPFRKLPTPLKFDSNSGTLPYRLRSKKHTINYANYSKYHYSILTFSYDIKQQNETRVTQVTRCTLPYRNASRRVITLLPLPAMVQTRTQSRCIAIVGVRNTDWMHAGGYSHSMETCVVFYNYGLSQSVTLVDGIYRSVRSLVFWSYLHRTRKADGRTEE